MFLETSFKVIERATPLSEEEWNKSFDEQERIMNWKEIKKRNLKAYEKCINQNKSNNVVIIKKFKSISRKYRVLNNDLYGFRDLVISVVCPRELLTSIENELRKD